MIRVVFALSLIATPVMPATNHAPSIMWERNACHAWRDHLHVILDQRARTGPGTQLDLDVAREAVVALGQRCDTDHPREAAQLLVLLLNLLAEDNEDS